jgi:agmatinase
MTGPGSRLSRFITAHPRFSECAIALLGLPLDVSASFKPGSKMAPDEVRRYSRNLETYSPYQRQDLRALKFFDAGNMEFLSAASSSNVACIEREAARFLAAGKKILGVGGEHTVSYPLIKALHAKHSDLAVIQLDAHADLRERYDDNPFSHACVMRRVTELIPFSAIFQFGIRSGTRDEFELMEKNRTLCSFDLRSFRVMARRLAGRPVYLTIDIDVFDPSLVSGTGTPEAGGIFFADFLSLLPYLRKLNIVGCDLVELAPEIDPSGVSSAVAALLVRELLLLLAA